MVARQGDGTAEAALAALPSAQQSRAAAAGEELRGAGGSGGGAHAAAGFDSVESALEAVGRGKFVVVLDDEDRENEGDLIMAADKVGRLPHLSYSVGCGPVLPRRSEGHVVGRASRSSFAAGVAIRTCKSSRRPRWRVGFLLHSVRGAGLGGCTPSAAYPGHTRFDCSHNSQGCLGLAACRRRMWEHAMGPADNF